MMRKSHSKAPLPKRFFAFVLDSLLAGMFLMAILAFMYREDFWWTGRAVFWSSYGLFNTAYYVLLECSPLQATMGKWIFNLKVIGKDGKRVTLVKALSRNVGKALIQLTYGQGLFRLLIPEKMQAIHDEFAGCLVVKR